MSDRVVLVDGSNLIYRAFFALPSSLQTPDGLPTNAIYGFATMFKKLLAAKRAVYGAVVFDAPGPTFRSERYPDYKGERAPMPNELREQLPWIDKVVAAHEYPLLRMPGYEADDVIGTLTRAAREAGCEVVIVSSDKDFAQLIGEGVKMLDTLKGVTYDAELVRKKWGVTPERFVDFLALMGDKVDNVPGVPGIGKKGAVELLEAYGDLDGVLSHVDELKGRRKTTLTENRDLALLSRELVTIDCAVPIEGGLESIRLSAEPPQGLNELYRELGFYRLLDDAAQVEDSTQEDRDYGLLRDPDDFAALLQAAEGGPVVWHPVFEGISSEPGGLGPRTLAGLACSPRVGLARYLPLCGPHAEPELASGGLGASDRWAPVRDHLGDPASPKLCHDAKRLFVALGRGGVALAGVEFDTRIASFLIDPTRIVPHRLDQLAKEFLHRTVAPRKRVVGSGKGERAWSESDLEIATEHACHLADAVAELGPLLVPKLAETGLEDHLRDHELPLSWLLGRVELKGVFIDAGELTALGRDLHKELAERQTAIYAHAGREFNINSTKQLGQVLFDELGLPVIKKTKTGYSTNHDVLTRLKGKHPIAEELLDYRVLAKLINTYVDVLCAAQVPATQRVHSVFQQTTGATGRLITTDPDLQRTPVRDARGERVRRAFVAPPGHVLISADWSQIELRILAHVSGDEALCAAFRDERDVHAHTAGQLFGCPPGEVTRAQRGVGKTVNFATIYGQGATALGQILGVPRKDAKAYIEGFFKTYAGVRAWLDATIAAAEDGGRVTTLLGRQRTIPELSSNAHMIRQAGLRIAANTPIQGSAADLCKLAMLQLERELSAAGLGAEIVLQIHDELLLEVPESEVEETEAMTRRVMETCVELRVPLVVDVGRGDSWAAAH
ncbi:MAG: DNA polymerase I [Planctomycetes bacterium]|nr:DNA polymerase I [Planctomycetota bacterium]